MPVGTVIAPGYIERISTPERLLLPSSTWSLRTSAVCSDFASLIAAFSCFLTALASLLAVGAFPVTTLTLPFIPGWTLQ